MALPAHDGGSVIKLFALPRYLPRGVLFTSGVLHSHTLSRSLSPCECCQIWQNSQLSSRLYGRLFQISHRHHRNLPLLKGNILLPFFSKRKMSGFDEQKPGVRFPSCSNCARMCAEDTPLLPIMWFRYEIELPYPDGAYLHRVPQCLLSSTFRLSARALQCTNVANSLHLWDEASATRQEKVRLFMIHFRSSFFVSVCMCILRSAIIKRNGEQQHTTISLNFERCSGA